MGYYAAADGNVRSKGTMFFVLHAQGEHAHGRWVGLSYDGPVVSGYATLARTQEQAQAVMTRLARRSRGAGMTTDDACEVIITAPDRDWLDDLCHQLVDARLAASAHVIHPVTSIYRWQGAVETTTEARAFLRSRRALLDELVAYVVERHPYEVPNVTALPLVGGNPDYLAWLSSETTAASGRPDDLIPVWRSSSASRRRRWCSTAIRSAAHARPHCAYARDATRPAKWRFRGSSPSEHLVGTALGRTPAL